MMFTQEDQEFLEKVAPTRTGKKFLQVLESFEQYHADIRNIGDVDPKVRIDALKLVRTSLIDKLKVLGQDERERPDHDEFL